MPGAVRETIAEEAVEQTATGSGAATKPATACSLDGATEHALCSRIPLRSIQATAGAGQRVVGASAKFIPLLKNTFSTAS